MSASISQKPASILPAFADSPAAAHLQVGGLTRFSASDYPGKLAAVVFVQGCPWRCHYCHNPHLQARVCANSGAPDWAGVMDFLQHRRSLLDAVVFSGGEPTIDPALPDAIAQVRALGFGVGLHSAGIYPQRLAAVLPLVDWVGLDYKAPLARLTALTGAKSSAGRVLDSVEALLLSGKPYEVRASIDPHWHSPDDLNAMLCELKELGVRHLTLQQCRDASGQPTSADFTNALFSGSEAMACSVLPPALAGGFASFSLRPA